MKWLRFYLRSTFVEQEGRLYIQSEGICIGSCLAPVLSDLLLAHLDRQLQDTLSGHSVLKVFRFVDDFLVLFKLDSSIDQESQQIFGLFAAILNTFTLTVELPSDGCLRFLDLVLCVGGPHTCWEYAQRSQKGLRSIRRIQSL